jgi:flagellar motor switch protein FliG
MATKAVVPRPPSPATGIEKAAILILTLGPEAASAVLRQLKEHEVRQLSTAIAKVRLITPAQAAAVHEEAWRRLTNRDGILVDGEHFARDLVGSVLAALGKEGPVSAGREQGCSPREGGEFLAETLQPLAPGVLAQVLVAEHPQVTALIIANLNPRQAAGVLAALPEDLQPDIVRRIADLQSVSGDVLAELGDVLQGQVQGLARAPEPSEAAGGAKLAAKILNVADKALEARVFAQLESEAPEVAEVIRSQMLTFEDLIVLDNRGMQVVLKEVAREDLMLALKTASPSMRDKVFGNISQRAAEILREDMSTMGPVKLKDVEKAQANIVAVVRRLEAEQKITLGAGGDDVIA